MKKTEFSSALLGERYIRMEHKSGLPLYIFPKKLTTTFAYFAVRYGSLDNAFCSAEGGDVITVPDGIAHFLEHKMFDNPDGSDSFARFAANGADVNAYTSYNRTAYLFSTTDRAEDSLRELLRFVTQPHFTKASVKKEQGIIAEEIRMYEDNPWECCMQNLLEAMYESHPVRKNICGTVESISRITPELLYQCYKTFYNPNNMALIICGDVDPETVARIADEELPESFKACAFSRVMPEEPRCVCKSFVKGRMQVAKPLFCIGIKDPDFGSTPEARLRRDMAMSLLDEILFSRSGSFYNRLFESGVITPSFGSGYSSAETFGFHALSGESDTPEVVLEQLMEYLAEVRKNGISEEDFERCKRVMYSDEICAYDSTEEIASRLLSFVFEDAEIFSCPAVLESITKAELEEILQTSLSEDCITLSVIDPLEESEKTEKERS